MQSTPLQIQVPFTDEFARGELSHSRNAVALYRHTGGAPLLMDVGRYNASVARGRVLNIAEWNDILDRNEHGEKSLFTNTPGDQQFVNFVPPEQAKITISIESNVRQCGRLRLMDKLHEFLRSEGYENVTCTSEYGPVSTSASAMEVSQDLIDAQKRVQISIVERRPN